MGLFDALVGAAGNVARSAADKAVKTASQPSRSQTSSKQRQDTFDSNFWRSVNSAVSNAARAPIRQISAPSGEGQGNAQGSFSSSRNNEDNGSQDMSFKERKAKEKEDKRIYKETKKAHDLFKDTRDAGGSRGRAMQTALREHPEAAGTISDYDVDYAYSLLDEELWPDQRMRDKKSERRLTPYGFEGMARDIVNNRIYSPKQAQMLLDMAEDDARHQDAGGYLTPETRSAFQHGIIPGIKQGWRDSEGKPGWEGTAPAAPNPIEQLGNALFVRGFAAEPYSYEDKDQKPGVLEALYNIVGPEKAYAGEPDEPVEGEKPSDKPKEDTESKEGGLDSGTKMPQDMPSSGKRGNGGDNFAAAIANAALGPALNGSYRSPEGNVVFAPIEYMLDNKGGKTYGEWVDDAVNNDGMVRPGNAIAGPVASSIKGAMKDPSKNITPEDIPGMAAAAALGPIVGDSIGAGESAKKEYQPKIDKAMKDRDSSPMFAPIEYMLNNPEGKPYDEWAKDHADDMVWFAYENPLDTLSSLGNIASDTAGNLGLGGKSSAEKDGNKKKYTNGLEDEESGPNLTRYDPNRTIYDLTPQEWNALSFGEQWQKAMEDQAHQDYYNQYYSDKDQWGDLLGKHGYEAFRDIGYNTDYGYKHDLVRDVFGYNDKNPSVAIQGWQDVAASTIPGLRDMDPEEAIQAIMDHYWAPENIIDTYAYFNPEDPAYSLTKDLGLDDRDAYNLARYLDDMYVEAPTMLAGENGQRVSNLDVEDLALGIMYQNMVNNQHGKYLNDDDLEMYSKLFNYGGDSAKFKFLGDNDDDFKWEYDKGRDYGAPNAMAQYAAAGQALAAGQNPVFGPDFDEYSGQGVESAVRAHLVDDLMGYLQNESGKKISRA